MKSSQSLVKISSVLISYKLLCPRFEEGLMLLRRVSEKSSEELVEKLLKVHLNGSQKAL